MITMHQVPDTATLLRLLDLLNEAGADYRVSGVDGDGEPFLAFLTGPYAESSGVLMLNPWDPEVEPYDVVRRCDECNAIAPFPVESLAYPVTAFTAHPVELETV